MRPLNFAILKYLTTVDEASRRHHRGPQGRLWFLPGPQ